MDAGIGHGDGGPVIKLLAPLSVGDRLPWKIDRDGEPQWEDHGRRGQSIDALSLRCSGSDLQRPRRTERPAHHPVLRAPEVLPASAA
jgi:hypothetical protein